MPNYENRLDKDSSIIRNATDYFSVLKPTKICDFSISYCFNYVSEFSVFSGSVGTKAPKWDPEKREFSDINEVATYRKLPLWRCLGSFFCWRRTPLIEMELTIVWLCCCVAAFDPVHNSKNRIENEPIGSPNPFLLNFHLAYSSSGDVWIAFWP